MRKEEKDVSQFISFDYNVYMKELDPTVWTYYPLLDLWTVSTTTDITGANFVMRSALFSYGSHNQKTYFFGGINGVDHVNNLYEFNGIDYNWRILYDSSLSVSIIRKFFR